MSNRMIPKYQVLRPLTLFEYEDLKDKIRESGVTVPIVLDESGNYEDRSETLKPIVIDTEVPEFDEFKGPDNFREVFHKYEQAVLKARNTAAEMATEEYMNMTIQFT